MEPIHSSSVLETTVATIGDELDRLEVPAGKIGLITSEQGFVLLRGLDSVYERMQELDPESPSRKVAEAQFSAIVLKMRSEAGRFVRDLGGVRALQQARAEVKPPADHWWWYLDEWLAKKRRATLRRLLIAAGAVVVVLALVALIYNKFLAPDPSVAARYGHEQNARDRLMNHDLQGALKEADLGLQIPPPDPALLVLKGVVLESLGQGDQAAQNFKAAEPGFPNRADFLVERGQDYLAASQPEKALADAQAAIQSNPDAAQAYLLMGQVYEVQQKYQNALDAYNKGFEVADKTKQTELAALARMRTAMLLQMMSGQMPTTLPVTPTPGQ